MFVVTKFSILTGWYCYYLLFFFFNDTAATKIYTLSLHDALPIYPAVERQRARRFAVRRRVHRDGHPVRGDRSEEHTSELQSRRDLVCRLLLEKKKLFMYTELRAVDHS